MKQSLALTLVFSALPALAEDTRQLDAHEHGVGTLNIAIEGTTIAMEFHAPGADIVGFEYAAESEIDRSAVDTAVATLATPLDLFVMPAAAKCSVTQASAKLQDDEPHEDHTEEAGHDDHSDKAAHTEFYAAYMLTCANSDALTEITFDYFNIFENARELDVQIITGSGAQAFEVEHDAPVLDLQSLF